MLNAPTNGDSRQTPGGRLAHVFRNREQIRAELGVEPVPVDAIRDPAIYCWLEDTATMEDAFSGIMLERLTTCS